MQMTFVQSSCVCVCVSQLKRVSEFALLSLITAQTLGAMRSGGPVRCVLSSGVRVQLESLLGSLSRSSAVAKGLTGWVVTS